MRRARTLRITRAPSSVSRRPDAAPVLARAHALEQPGALEAVDVPGERGRGDAFLGRQLGEREAGAALHEPEQRRLPCGDPELLGLLPELAREPKEHRAELGCDLFVTNRNLANH